MMLLNAEISYVNPKKDSWEQLEIIVNNVQ
jgi:hypothetical protein